MGCLAGKRCSSNRLVRRHAPTADPVEYRENAWRRTRSPRVAVWAGSEVGRDTDVRYLLGTARRLVLSGQLTSSKIRKPFSTAALKLTDWLRRIVARPRLADPGQDACETVDHAARATEVGLPDLRADAVRPGALRGLDGPHRPAASSRDSDQPGALVRGVVRVFVRRSPARRSATRCTLCRVSCWRRAIRATVAGSTATISSTSQRARVWPPAAAIASPARLKCASSWMTGTISDVRTAPGPRGDSGLVRDAARLPTVDVPP